MYHRLPHTIFQEENDENEIQMKEKKKITFGNGSANGLLWINKIQSGKFYDFCFWFFVLNK